MIGAILGDIIGSRFEFDRGDKTKDFTLFTYESEYTDDTALILGEEVHGIPPEILAHCDKLLEIPMCGKKESFNVSVAGGIALWELRKSTLNDKRMHLRTPE